MVPSTRVPPFLRLPLELRYGIYDHLCPVSPLSYPYRPTSPITAIDIRGPPMSLLLLHRTILEEITNYYFSRCTFRFVARSFKPRNSDVSEGFLHIVRKARKIELLLLPGTMKPSATDSAQMFAGWLDELVGLFRDEARELKTVIVSMRRVFGGYRSGWSEMEALWKPLEVLKGRVEFRIGEVIGPGSMEDMMRDELGVVLGRLNG